MLVARASFADNYVVPSGSMEPTVQVGDRILVNKLAYGLRVPLTERYAMEARPPERGDVVVLDEPTTGVVLLKRVVAVPGDRVEVRRGIVAVDGSKEEVVAASEASLLVTAGSRRYALDLSDGGGPDFGPLVVPANHFLVLGDHRGNSRDGRYFGLVARQTILGRATGVFWRRGGAAWSAL